MNKLIGIGPDFPKCPIDGKEMRSVPLSQVPQRDRKKMMEAYWWKRLDPNYWYYCDEDDVYIHKHVVGRK
jgi:hypothetical protein